MCIILWGDLPFSSRLLLLLHGECINTTPCLDRWFFNMDNFCLSMLGKVLSFLEKVEEGEIEEEDRIRREFVIWRREKKWNGTSFVHDRFSDPCGDKSIRDRRLKSSTLAWGYRCDHYLSRDWLRYRQTILRWFLLFALLPPRIEFTQWFNNEMQRRVKKKIDHRSSFIFIIYSWQETLGNLDFYKAWRSVAQ